MVLARRCLVCSSWFVVQRRGVDGVIVVIVIRVMHGMLHAAWCDRSVWCVSRCVCTRVLCYSCSTSTVQLFHIFYLIASYSCTGVYSCIALMGGATFNGVNKTRNPRKPAMQKPEPGTASNPASHAGVPRPCQQTLLKGM